MFPSKTIAIIKAKVHRSGERARFLTDMGPLATTYASHVAPVAPIPASASIQAHLFANSLLVCSLFLFLFLSLIPGNAFSQPSITLGKSAWTLKISAQDASLLQALRPNTYIPWCFDFIKGRGLLKQITLSLHWASESLPQLALAKKEIQPGRDDRDIISCLDASFKAFPPQHERASDELEFTLIRNRR